MTKAGQVSGEAFNKALAAEAARTNFDSSAIAARVATDMAGHGQRAGRGFGSAFTSELAQSIPGVAGFEQALYGYHGAAQQAGALAGRALGLAFTAAAGAAIGIAAYTLFKGFERYELLDQTTYRLRALNQTLEATGKAGIDVEATMRTVNDVVLNTPFALDQAFSLAVTGIASGVTDIQGFLTSVADAAAFTGQSLADVGQAFTQVVNQGWVDAQMLNNQLRNLPVRAWLMEVYGLDGAQLQKAIASHQVGADQLRYVIDSNISGMAKTLGTTLGGAISNLQISFARVGADLLAALFGKPAEGASTLTAAIESVRARVDDVDKWIKANGDEIKDFFTKAADACTAVVNAIGAILNALNKVPGGVEAVVGAFIAFESIKGVIALHAALTGIGTMLTAALPAAAVTAAASISSALGPVALLLAGIYAATNGHPEQYLGGGPKSPKSYAEEGDWGHVLFGDAWDWIHGQNLYPGQPGQPVPGANPPAPSPVNPDTAVRGGDNKFYIPADQGDANAVPIPGTNQWGIPSSMQSQSGSREPGGGWGGRPVGPPPPLQPPVTPGGAGGPSAPVLPYPADYGQPPMLGETPEHYQNRQTLIKQQWDLANDQARLDQLEAQGNADQNDLTAARNKIIEDKLAIARAEEQLNKADRQNVADKAEVPYPTGYGAPPRPGVTAEQYGKEQAVLETVHSRQQAEARLAQVQADSTSSADDLVRANNDLLKARQAENEAVLRLNDSSSRAADQLGDIGVKLDQDFGLSRGLPGLAENLTRFLANLAFAPAMGAMRGAQAGAGYPGGEGSGSGVAGIIGSMMLGPGTPRGGKGGAQDGGAQFPFGGQPGGAFPGGYPTSPSGLPMTYPGGSPYPASGQPNAAESGYRGDAALLSSVPRGGHYDAAGDLAKGLADCTSGIEDLVNMMDGRPTAGRSMATGNAAEWLTSRGFMPGSAPGAFNVGYNSHHMEGTLPGGTNVNYGSDSSVASGGTRGAVGAFDPSFTSHYYRPVGSYAEGGGTDTVPAMLTPGEHVLTTQDVNAMGGQQGVYQFRAGLQNPGGGPGGARPSTPGVGPTAVGGVAPPTGQGPGFGITGGGLIGLAESLPSTAISMAITGAMAAAYTGGAVTDYGIQGFEGGGSVAGSVAGSVISAAINIGMEEANRAIGFAGQAAGIGVSGLMETFLPAGGSELAQNNWVTRILGGIVGARPVLPNLSGKAASAQQQPGSPLTPEQVAAQVLPPTRAEHTGTAYPPGPTNGVYINNYSVTQDEDQAGRRIAEHTMAAYPAQSGAR